MQAAVRLSQAKEADDLVAMFSAVRLNWRLWTIIQSDLLDPDNEVPLEIKANILSLANFIDKQSVAFLSEPDPAKLDALVNINRELSSAQMQKPAEPAAEEGAPEAAQPAPHHVPRHAPHHPPHQAPHRAEPRASEPALREKTTVDV